MQRKQDLKKSFTTTPITRIRTRGYAPSRICRVHAAEYSYRRTGNNSSSERSLRGGRIWLLPPHVAWLFQSLQHSLMKPDVFRRWVLVFSFLSSIDTAGRGRSRSTARGRRPARRRRLPRKRNCNQGAESKAHMMSFVGRKLGTDDRRQRQVELLAVQQATSHHKFRLVRIEPATVLSFCSKRSYPETERRRGTLHHPPV